MFIRVTCNAAGQAYYHLVESYRNDGKVKQRTLLSLGRVEDGKLEQLAQAVAKHTDLLSALDIAKTVAVENTYVLGPLLVLRGLFSKLGIDVALSRSHSARRRLTQLFDRSKRRANSSSDKPNSVRNATSNHPCSSGLSASEDRINRSSNNASAGDKSHTVTRTVSRIA